VSASPRLYINNAPELDWLIALEFGRVDDAQPSDNWRGVSDQLGFLYETPGGRCLGFKLVEFSTFDPDAGGVEEIWSGPLFDVPLLGLEGASAGETILATRALLGDQPSINRVYFNEAARADDPNEALMLWSCCLEAGDSMAHFGLGYTLYELERYQEAYRHLRRYTEIAPCGSWNWCWFGRAAEAVGELAEARRAYERAVELEAEDSYDTDAAERLAKLAG
jgi:tetratricopeptide (TPR) repeat protein